MYRTTLRFTPVDCSVGTTDVLAPGDAIADALDTSGAGGFFDAGVVRATLRGTDGQTAATFGNRCARTAMTSFELRGKLDGLAAVSSLG